MTNKYTKGFTVVEMIVAAALIMVVISVAYYGYVLAKDAWLFVSVQGEMQRNAMLGVERMVHGVDGSLKGLHEAQGIISPTPGNSDSSIEFTDGVNNTLSRAFGINTDKLEYVDEANNSSDLIDQDVQTVTFNRPSGRDDLIEIGLVLQRVVAQKTITVNLNTSVKLRNM